MAFQSASYGEFVPQNDGYRVSTGIYEGPLDLLLELIEHAELDITTLALAQITDQYLAYLKNIEHHDLAEVSAFLVIAARLLQIKSAALLPKPALMDQRPEEDPGEALARQLILYRRFKQLGTWLYEREEAGLRSFLRVASLPVKVEPKLDMSGLTLDDLLQAVKEIILNPANLAELSIVMTSSQITIRERIATILTALKGSQKTKFRSFLNSSSRLEVVVTFLALLELIKRHVVEFQQEVLFGEIELESVGEWMEMDEADIEFE